MPTNIDRVELLRLIEHGEVQIVDVLPEPEYTAAHIPGAVNIALKRLDSEAVSALRRDKPVVVY